MSKTEQLYQHSIARTSPKERVARSVEMFNWSRELIGRQIQAEFPGISYERLKLLVALRMYGGEPAMKKLLEGLLADVPN